MPRATSSDYQIMKTVCEKRTSVRFDIRLEGCPGSAEVTTFELNKLEILNSRNSIVVTDYPLISPNI